MRIALLFMAFSLSVLAADGDGQQSPPAQAPAPTDTKPADAAAPATPPAPPAKLNGWVVSAMADGYFTENLNHPSSNSNQLQNFDLKWGQPELSLAKVTIDKSDKVIGMHIDAGFGETMRLIHSADPAAIDHQAFRYIEQMYVIAKPNHTHGAEFDFGEFVTSAGAEVIESNANWNYSRSILFAWAIPYYHFGLRTSVPVTKDVSVGFQLINAWNTLWGNNTLDNVGLTLAVTKKKYVYNLNYYFGPNHQGTTSGKRNLIDSTLTLTPNAKLSLYINGDYGRDNHIGGGGGDPWYGIAGAARYQITGKIAIAGRAEIFNDVNGFSTGTKQVLKEATVTGEYKHNDHFLGRVEYRHDSSDHPFFDRGGQTAVAHNMTTFTIGIVAILGPIK